MLAIAAFIALSVLAILLSGRQPLRPERPIETTVEDAFPDDAVSADVPARPDGDSPRNGGGAESAPSGGLASTTPDDEDRADTFAFTFNNRRFVAATNAAARFMAARHSLHPGSSLPVLIGLREIPSGARRTQLREQGVDLLAYLPDHGWVARLQPGPVDERWSREQVRCFQPLDAPLRISDSAGSPCECDLIPLFVHLLPDADPLASLAALRRGGVELSVHHAGDSAYLAARVERNVQTAFLAAAGRHADVLIVERGGGARLLNDNSMRILQSGVYTGGTPVFARGIHGSNQIIAVCDTGLDLDNCYYRDTNGAVPPTNRVTGTNVNGTLRKVIAADFLHAGDDPAVAAHWDNQGHGTHVAGDACGSSITDPLGTFSQNGMAPAAKLIVQDAGFTAADNCADLIGLGCPVTNFLPALQQAYAQGARIHNNSWGDNENGVFGNRNLYTQASRDLDAIVWAQRDFLVVCAAGNDGGLGNDQVASPSNAKNGLSVAATVGGSGADAIASFSSRGWTADGRAKPDLAAPGSSIAAASSDGSIATSNCTTSVGSGTSYASPLVAGLAALVRDYLAQGFYPSRRPVSSNAYTSVSAALVKALLITACRSMSGVGPAPSREQGWGRPDLGLGLAFTNSAHRLFLADAGPVFAAAPAQPFTAYLDVHSTNVPLKVVLAWTDYPGTPGSGKQLVNDLDLLVRTPAGSFRGNRLSNGVSIAGGPFDRSNNVEQVFLTVPATGLVEVSVWAHVIPQATQDFAIAASGDFTAIPRERDEDADGLPDYFERLHYGALAAVLATDDSDGDGADEWSECIAGTEPTNAASRFAIQHLAAGTNGTFDVSIPFVAGRAYALLAGTEPVPATVVASFIAGTPETNGVFSIADTNATASRIFGARVTAP